MPKNKELDKKTSTMSTMPEQGFANEEEDVENNNGVVLMMDDAPLHDADDKKNKKLYSDDDEYSQESSLPESAKPSKFSKAWTNALVKIRKPIAKVVCAMADAAAAHPKMTVAIGIVLAFELAIIGVLTNFYLEVDGDVLWTPTPSRVLSHGDYMKDVAGFPAPPRFSLLAVHADGANVLENPEEGMRRVFAFLDTVTSTPGYEDVCNEATVTMKDENGDDTCGITSITKYYSYSLTSFNEEVTNGASILSQISQPLYPDGTPAQVKAILGSPVFDTSNQLTSAKTFLMTINFPETDTAFEFEEEMLDRVLALQEEWVNEAGNSYRLEIFAERSFDDEFSRAIVADIPLVPLIFVVMSMFTGLVFFRRNWIHSRVILGVGAVCSVFLSIMVGYGIMFIIGVPFTSMTQIVPFIMFGIGLDDAFIIWGAYQRMDRSIPVLDRIHDTMEEVGVSIFVTTFTSVVAFALGGLSKVPAVYWLCYYAAPTIFIDFIYQTTFFVALIVLDEERVEAKKRDCFTCLKAPERADGQDDEVPQETIADRFMAWYSDILMKPAVKVLVLAVFFGIFGGLGYSASLLKQEFYFTDVLPSDSYVADFWDNYNANTGGTGVAPYVVFRDVNQGDLAIQDQMVEYVNSIVAMDEVEGQPDFFWVRDFQSFLTSTQTMSSLASSFPTDSDAYSTYRGSSSTVQDAMADLAFEQQLDVFLTVPSYNELYSDNIVRNTAGNITVSRTRVRMSQVNQRKVEAQVDALDTQRAISEVAPINVGVDPDNWKFFTFDELYYIWQFYTESPSELVLTTILGVSAVSIISLIFIPHWSSVLFVAPIISILYVDLLGFLQLCGVAINAVSYISLVMSIGLMVDFLLHILLRFFESKETTRDAKVKDVLQTMGTSILIGGISTFLGVLPLVFSSSTIFSTIFYCFLGLVVLGITHGLIFLPVVLSLLGPTVVLELQ
jgi:Niemann-Pick C1 protein